MYPDVRMRRLRKAPWIRDLVAENHLKPSDLIMPFFVCDGVGISEEIKTMPNIFRLSVDMLVQSVKMAWDIGIKMVALFPVVEVGNKDDTGSYALDKNNVLCKAVKMIKKEVPNIGVMVDIALDPYTLHCHDGIFDGFDVDNDKTIDVLVKQSIMMAEHGCDVLAPSDMMDGRIGAIRMALEERKFDATIIASYGAKYASSFYSPFRDAVKSNRNCEDGGFNKKTYQMDYRNGIEAQHEVELDIDEGADMVIIKPGMPCLDVVYRVSQNCMRPVLAYQVSAEYLMLNLLKTICDKNYDDIILESLYSFKRAGARGIITYAALDVAKRLCIAGS